MCAAIFNRDSNMCIENLKEFLNRWKVNYTEEHPLSDMFKKIVLRILQRCEGKIENPEYAKWFNEMFLDNIGHNGHLLSSNHEMDDQFGQSDDKVRLSGVGGAKTQRLQDIPLVIENN